ncbi:MAG: RNA polymerase sigma factor [Firmicutes bacterium]|nr:RNA polymerase sigma factor [Bacillota bacterium]
MHIKMNKSDKSLREKREEELWSYRDEVIHYLSVFDINSDQLEDAVQDTMINAWKNIDQLRDDQCLKSWLFVIARNIGLKYVNMHKTHRSMFVDFSLFADTLAEEGSNPLNDNYICSQFTNHSGDVILEIEKCLKPKEAKVVILYYIYGHSLKEIAKMVGESYANTRQISKRAMDKMRKYFKEAENE